MINTTYVFKLFTVLFVLHVLWQEWPDRETTKFESIMLKIKSSGQNDI